MLRSLAAKAGLTGASDVTAMPATARAPATTSDFLIVSALPAVPLQNGSGGGHAPCGPPRLAGMGWGLSSKRIKRPTILRFPTDRNRGAGLQLHAAFVVRQLDHKIIVPADRNSGANMVTQIDQLLDLGAEDIGHRALGGVDLHPLRPQRQDRLLANAADINRERPNRAAARDVDLAGGAIHARHLAAQPVVLADELGDEGVVRALVQVVR